MKHGYGTKRRLLALAHVSAIVVAGLMAQAQDGVRPASCQTCAPGLGNACQPPIQGVDCAMGNGCGEPHWKAWGPIPWQAFGQGEYAGPPRMSHVPEYRLRVDDQVEFVYRLKRDEDPRP